MSIALSRRQNARNHVLELGTRAQSVGVRRSGGEYRYYPWAGFVARSMARKLEGARSARLEIARIGVGEGFSLEWIEVPAGSHVLGCVFEGRAYAVLDDSHRPAVV